MSITLKVIFCVGNEEPFEHENYPPVEDCYELQKTIEYKICPQIGWQVEWCPYDKNKSAGAGCENNLARVLGFVVKENGDAWMYIAPEEYLYLTFKDVEKELLAAGWSIVTYE